MGRFRNAGTPRAGPSKFKVLAARDRLFRRGLSEHPVLRVFDLGHTEQLAAG